MQSNNWNLPLEMRALHKVQLDHLDKASADFEPYPQFLSLAETQSWLSAWTGNPDADGSSFRVFGQDGTGGYAAFWLVREGEDVLEQPIVFLGSEGEIGVVARNFSDYLWISASGHGPYEAVCNLDDKKVPDATLTAFADQHATTTREPASVLVAKARAEFPDFEQYVESLSR